MLPVIIVAIDHTALCKTIDYMKLSFIKLNKNVHIYGRNAELRSNMNPFTHQFLAFHKFPDLNTVPNVEKHKEKKQAGSFLLMKS